MRKPISKTTLKRLFALSGNVCAFPECDQVLVNDSGNFVGQICHIEAAEVGGERYNPSQTDAERADFNNLILLCANHHIETNNVTKYTVSILKDFKKNHEKKFTNKTYKIPNKTLEESLAAFNGVQNNQNTGNGYQMNNQALSIVVNNQGMTTEQGMLLFQHLFEVNFPRFEAIADNKAKENINKYETHFFQEAPKQLTQEEMSKFTDPDIQFVLNSSINSCARKDDEQLRKMLTDLIIKRIKNDADDLKQKVLNGAITATQDLTTNQMKIITLCFLMKHCGFENINSMQEFKAFLERQIKPFVYFKGTLAEFQHIQYSRCGNIEEFMSVSIPARFKKEHSFLFAKGSEKEEIDNLEISQDIKNVLFREHTENHKIYFNVRNEVALQKYIDENNYDNKVKNMLINFYNQKLPPDDDAQKIMEEQIPWIKDLFKAFKDTKIGNLTLTSVGIAIAISYYEQNVATPLDLDIWIK